MKHQPPNIFIDSRFDTEYARHPLVLVDVGARGGLKPNWSAAEKHLRVIGFEPDEQEYARLSQQTDASRTFFHAALHNRRERVRLYVAKDHGLSSIFPPNREFVDAFPDAERFDTVEVRDVQADTLDNLLASRQLTDVDFIKADTQGSELFVLQGATRAIESTVVGVEVEAEFAPVYQSQPLFGEVDAFLRGQGFFLFDLRPVRWKRAVGRNTGGPYGQVVWVDALYLKSVPMLESMVAAFSKDLARSKILRSISVALLYGYVDYALTIANAARALPPEDREVVNRALRAQNPARRHPLFPGRRRLAAVFRSLWRVTRVSDGAWSVSDSEIGNLD